MIQQAFGGMVALLLAKFMLNDVPHAAGLGNKPISTIIPKELAENGRYDLYHITHKSNVPSILQGGLIPQATTKTLTGKIPKFVSRGVYLITWSFFVGGYIDTFITVGYAEDDLEVLEVKLPGSWPVHPDPDSQAMADGFPTVVYSVRSIPPSMIKVWEG